MLKDILGLVSLLGFMVISILCMMAAKFGSEWATKMMDTILPAGDPMLDHQSYRDNPVSLWYKCQRQEKK